MSLKVWFEPRGGAGESDFRLVGTRATGQADSDPFAGALQLAMAKVDSAAEPGARASVWIAEDLAGAPGRSGLIGHYEAMDGEVGVHLLHAVCEELARFDVRRILGPVNGDTWHRYRLELARGPGDPEIEPANFATEPRNPARYAADFEAAGFAPVARYESRYEPRPVVDAKARAIAEERMRAGGLRSASLDPHRFEETLGAMHTLSLEAFAVNPYYSPLSREAFLALYAPFRTRIVPELVRLAFDANDRLVGYLFGFPDALALENGRPTRTVCKTIAVARDARGLGLGGLLLDEFRAASLALGARGILHALMHVDNVSMRLSSRRASVLFKRYALYGREP